MENKYDCVKGNHEEMLLEYGPTKEELYFNDESKHWLYSCGGDETLTSYNNKKRNIINIMIFKLFTFVYRISRL